MGLRQSKALLANYTLALGSAGAEACAVHGIIALTHALAP